jgi:hypothetical protein
MSYLFDMPMYLLASFLLLSRSLLYVISIYTHYKVNLCDIKKVSQYPIFLRFSKHYRGTKAKELSEELQNLRKLISLVLENNVL